MQLKTIIAAATLTSIAGCGAYVPEIEEGNDPRAGQRLVEAIVTNVRCEVQDAFYDLYHPDPSSTKKIKTFMDNWGVQLTLKLTIEEKSTVAPTINLLPPSPTYNVFNVAGSLSGSADATRIETMNSYFLVQELQKKKCPPSDRGGPFILESDLKLEQWLYDMSLAQGSGDVNFKDDSKVSTIKSNVISHEVKFDIISSGSVTPTWKLVSIQYNPTGNLFTTSRERTNDLTITIGPTDSTQAPAGGGKKNKTPPGPSLQASNIHLSNLIGSSVGQAVTSALKLP